MPSKAASSARTRRSPRPLSGIVHITRQVHFNAAHRLHNPSKSRVWNEKHFGPCANDHMHGHNYVLEVTIAGLPNPETGYVMNLVDLKDILNRVIVDKCDHKSLNQDVDFLKGVNPSTENLVIAFWEQLEEHLPAGALERVRLYETPRNFAEYYGEKPTQAS